MKDLIIKLLDLVPVVVPWLVPLLAVYIGWKLSYYSESKRRALEIVNKRLNALRELKQVASNIPRGLTAQQLADRMEKEPDLYDSLKHRLQRLFGLRIELIPYLDESTIQLLDERFAPLFDTRIGHSDLRDGNIKEFASVCVDVLNHVDQLEANLVESHRKLIRK